jgi:hypothetical protein
VVRRIGIQLRVLLILLAPLSLAIPLRSAAAHPIHMSYTEARYSAASHTLQLWVRVYANDFAAAAARKSGLRLGRDSVIDPSIGALYLRQNIQLIDANGHSLNVASCGARRANDMLLFCVQTGPVAPMDQLRMRNTVMTELFSDQVNVVQTLQGSVRASRLFVRGDGFKALVN